MNDQKWLIVIVGPTASGKTNLSVDVASQLKSEIISADSRQVYKEMTIGTAVPSPAQIATVPHHFIQSVSIHTPYSVGEYERDSLHFLSNYYKSHSTAILVGGSGLYIQAVCNGLDKVPTANEDLRKKLTAETAEKGVAYIAGLLQKNDPAYYEVVDKSNPHRIIRALEVFYTTGIPFSSFRTSTRVTRPFSILKIGIHIPREILNQRIDARVDHMVANGLLQEARSLYPHRHLNALQTVGYKELFTHFEGLCTEEEAINAIKINTRKYAKRQMTWFRRDPDIHWFSTAETQPIHDLITNTLYNKPA